jgi:peptide chain release factor subunit 1
VLTREAVEALAAFDGQGAPVLSVYLDLDPARQVRRSYRIAFEDLVKDAQPGRSEAESQALRSEADRVHAWLDDQPPRGTGLAFFSCTPRGLWQVHPFAVRVRDHLAFEPAPDVALLLALLDEYERYAVALVDKGRARLFSVFLGEIEEHATFQEELLPPKTERGGLAQSHYQRHHELHAHWHLKRVAERLAELHRRRPFERLILAGPEEATSMLRGLLPRALAHRLVAVIPAETTAGDAEILRITLDVERRIEREMEERLFGRLLDRAGPGGRATLGLVPTLDALWADIVQTLVVADGAHRPGRECPNCARLEPGEVAACPACGTAMRPLHDLVHRAMSRTLHQAGAVEVVHGRVARDLQERGEGLGALLRYPSPVVAARTD